MSLVRRSFQYISFGGMATAVTEGGGERARTVSLCADDYALSPGVSRAIRTLAGQGRISATSCMTLFDDWRHEAPGIRELTGAVEVGLHLVLTDAPCLGPMPSIAPSGRMPTLGRMMMASHLGLLSRTEIADEVSRQLDAFERATGFPPAFIDGHRHVHSLPIVRDVVSGLFGSRLDRTRTWMRVCTAPLAAMLRHRIAIPQTLVIDRLSRPLARLALARGIRTNHRFAGINRFDGAPVAPLFDAWLDDAGPGTLIMCHPGEVDEVLRSRDPVLAPRVAEFEYLGGEQFSEALAIRGLKLGPLRARGRA